MAKSWLDEGVEGKSKGVWGGGWIEIGGSVMESNVGVVRS
jgi:hypothetical protein